MTYKIARLYHPSHRVPNLEAADTFFQNVFGIASVWRSSLFQKPDPRYPDYPTDYCIFTSIADVFFDCIDPSKYIIDGKQRYESVEEPHLNGLGWSVEGIDEIYAKVQTIGVKCTDQANRPSDPKICPVASFKPSKLFYTEASSSGLRYEFYPVESVGPYDHRSSPTWDLQPQQEKGALGIQYCSHHTILTSNKARAKALYVDILGGKVIHECETTLRQTSSLFIKLADAVYEFATPVTEESYAAVDFRQRADVEEDVYHALTWKVHDLAATKAHLETCRVTIIAEDHSSIVISAKHGLGIPWGFSVATIPNDDRFST